MKAKDVQIGETYTCRVSGKLVPVRVIAQYGRGYRAVNLVTRREITTRSAARLRTHIGDETSAHAWIANHA